MLISARGETSIFMIIIKTIIMISLDSFPSNAKHKVSVFLDVEPSLSRYNHDMFSDNELLFFLNIIFNSLKRAYM